MNEYIKGRAQIYNPVCKMWTKFNTKEGGAVGHKKDGTPYKNVRIYKRKIR